MARGGASSSRGGAAKEEADEATSSNAATKLISVLKRLPLDAISSDEVQAMMQGELDGEGVDALPAAKMLAAAPEDLLEPILREVTKVASRSQAPKEKNSVALLTEVATADVDLKKVVTLLLQGVFLGSDLGFMAGSVYLGLISLPGSAIYSMVNTSTTSAVFQLMKTWIVTRAAESRKNSSKSPSAASGKKAASAKKKDSEMDVDDENEAEEAEGEGQGEEDLPKGASAEETIRAMNAVSPARALQMASMIIAVARNTPLEMQPETLSGLAETATVMTRFRVADTGAKKAGAKGAKRNKGADGGDDSAVVSVTGDDAQQMRKLGYEALFNLVDSKHGALQNSTTIVFKTILSNILGSFPMLFLPATSNSSSGRDFTDIRNGAIDVVSRLAADSTEMESSCIFDAILALLQHLCLKVPEKAELRHGAGNAIVSILVNLPKTNKFAPYVKRFVSFLDKYAKNQKPTYRLFSVELAESIITNKTVVDTIDNEETRVLSPEGISALMSVIVQRCADKSVTVRAKAVGSIASILETVHALGERHAIRKQITSILFSTAPSQPEKEAEEHDPIMSPPAARKQPQQQPQSQANAFLAMIKRRVSDEKANVRKSALQVLEMLGRSRFEGVSITADDVAILQERCYDPQVAIRKQALLSLSELFKAHPTNKLLLQSWVATVPSLTYDTEQTVQDKVTQYVEEIIFEQAIQSFDNPSAPVWQVLEEIDRGSIDASQNLNRICQQLARESRIPKPVFKSLLKALEKHDTKGAWILLAHVAPFWPQLVDTDFVVAAWEKIRDKPTATDTDDLKTKILRVLVHVTGQMKPNVGSKVAHDMVARLERFDLRPSVIQSLIQAASALQHNFGKKTDDWMRTLLQKADAALGAAALGDAAAAGADTIDSIEKLDAYLFSVGELAQRCSKEILPRRTVSVVQTLIAPSFEGIKLADSEELLQIPASSRAQAFITLGKMCLQDQSLAKSCIPAFARELEISTNSVVRNNVMVVLCDLTIRYTNLVDNYIGKIAVCLRDESELVRRQTLMLLTNLMKEGYIKLRSGPLFFRLIFLLVDDSASLRQFAGVCLDAITTRADADKNLYYNHFVEAIFYLNDYRMHPTYNKFSQTDRERSLFSIRGPGVNQLKRIEIYKTMLQRMSDDQKFQVASQMCREILNAVTESQLVLDEHSGYFVLQDALLVLCSKEIKIKMAGFGASDDGAEDISENSQKLLEAKGKILSKLMKKNIVENIVPIVIELKHALAKSRSPLLGNLMDYLRELMKDYKDDIQDIFASDRQLAQELEYEFRLVNASARERQQMEKAQQQKQNQQNQQAQAAPSVQAPQNMQSPRAAAAAALGSPGLAPRLKVAVAPGAYKPSPAKVRHETSSLNQADGASESSANVAVLAQQNRRASMMTSPTLARIRSANINFMSPSKSKTPVIAVSGPHDDDDDDDDVPAISPAKLDLSAAGQPEDAKGKAAKKTAAAKGAKKVTAKKASAKATAAKKTATNAKRKRTESESEDEGSGDEEEEQKASKKAAPEPKASGRPARNPAPKRARKE